MKYFYLLFVFAFTLSLEASYEPNWKSLDSRPTPGWWTEAKFGIFIHWGPYAVPAYAPVSADGSFSWGGFSEWYQGRLIEAKKKGKKHAHHEKFYNAAPYANFASEFKARFYDANKWAELFKRCGAKYVVLTSKHHDGYALWPSAQSPYFNSVAVGSGRDLAGEFAEAMKKAGLRRGFYFSLLEYANPLYPGIRDSVKTKDALDIKEWSRQVSLPQLKDLVSRYSPDIVWADGEWDYNSSDHLAEEFLSWLYTSSPVKDDVVVNDRWGKDSRGIHGGHYTTEYGAGERGAKADKVIHPWEECRGIGGSFGYNRFEDPKHYMSRKKCIETLVGVCARGGNLLLNVGPDPDGLIPPIMEDRLLAIGRWLDVNGEAIYGSKRWDDADLKLKKNGIYFTQKGDNIYVICFKWPRELDIKKTGEVSSVAFLGCNSELQFEQLGDGIKIKMPNISPSELPCEHAWVFRITRKVK